LWSWTKIFLFWFSLRLVYSKRLGFINGFYEWAHDIRFLSSYRPVMNGQEYENIVIITNIVEIILYRYNILCNVNIDSEQWLLCQPELLNIFYDILIYIANIAIMVIYLSIFCKVGLTDFRRKHCIPRWRQYCVYTVYIIIIN